MVKKTNYLLSGALALLAALPTQTISAQLGLRPAKAKVKEVMAKVKPGQVNERQKAFELKHPLLAQVKNFGTPKATLNRGLKEMKLNYVHVKSASAKSGVAKAPSLAAATGRELWGNVAYQTGWSSEYTAYGMYTFNATSPISVNSIALNDDLQAVGGGALVDGVFHEVNYFSFWGMIFMTHYAFDTDTWEETVSESVDDYAMLAKETAVAHDGTVYGEFYSSNLDGLELGVADYNTMTRTTIGSLTKSYVALGITSDKKIYGVASDGNLYKISADDATETLVGPTGLTIADASGSYYGQSGEIDFRTNIFYWAAINADGESALYTVDLTTGAATKVSDFPAEEQIYALTVPDPAAVDDAPGLASDVELDFEGASLSGVVSFAAPAETYGGGELKGALAYYVVAGNDTIATGVTTAGAKVATNVTVPADGTIKFKVTTANDFGSSPKATVTKYIGYDTPEAIGSVTLNADAKTGDMKLTWTAPKVGKHNGYVGALKYDVVRYPDSVTVATDLADTVFAETLNATEAKAYSYGVVAINGTKRGDEATSNKAVLGPAIVPPYVNTLESDDAFDLLTVIDANNDGRTWFLYNYNEGEGHARCQYNSSLAADDWLLTPTLKLEAGKEYVVSFEAANYLSYYPERLEVKYGNGDDPTAYTGEILPATDLTSAVYTKYSKTIVPEADEEVKIGFHGISDPDMYYLLLDNIKVSEGSAITAPDSATAIAVVAGAQGAPTATVSFTLPTKTISGGALSTVAKAEILRDGVVVGSVADGLTPGGTVSFTDTDVPNGSHIYSVRVYNENGGGRTSVETSVFVGVDVPGALARDGIKLADNTTSIGLSWNAVTTGANGGYVDPSEMWYNVYSVAVDDYGYAELSLVDSVKATTSYDIPYITNDGDQKLVNFALSAKNEMGEGAYAFTNSIVCGKPYTIPFREQFAVSNLAYDLWWSTQPGSSSWGLLSGVSTDGQGGSAVFNGTGDAAYFATGKISIAGATNPKLVFSTCSDANSNATITVLIRRFDGTVDSIAAVDYTPLNTMAATAWAKKVVSLAKYMNDPYVIVQFRGEGVTEGYIYIDDINVRDVYENDLAAEISAPESVKKGDKATVNVKVTNFGDNVASAYTVKLYAGSTLVETKEVTEPLASFESTTFAFDYKTSAFDENSSVELSATVDFANDLNPDDNTASATVELLTSTKPAPASATATPSGSTAEVAWTAPATTKAEVTEDFESYATWSVDKFGDWTCYDGDKGATGSMFNSYSYGHQGEAFAFEIWEPEAIFEGCLEGNPTLAPHSGNKYAAALYSVGDNSTFPDADNWLISPTLSGDKQTVKFYAMNQGDSETSYAETIVLLYATDGGSDISTFVPVDTVVIDQNAWTEVSFEVPAGATNFAIHHVTVEGGFLLGIDDVTYIAGAGTLVGYNIYRDGELVASVPADASSYTDATSPAEGAHTYAVTAVYADGESAPVAATPVIISAIKGVDTANGKTYNVYTVDGKRVGSDVKSLDGLKKGVYIVNDKKSIVK